MQLKIEHFCKPSSSSSYCSTFEFFCGRILLTNTLPSFPFPMWPVAPVDLRVGTVSSNVSIGSLLYYTWLKIWTYGTLWQCCLLFLLWTQSKPQILCEISYLIWKHVTVAQWSFPSRWPRRSEGHGSWQFRIWQSPWGIRRTCQEATLLIWHFYIAELVSGFPVVLGS